MENQAVNQATSLESAIDIGFLVPEKATFYKTEGGFTGLKYGEADHKRIVLRRALPVGRPTEYISVADGENKEIAIIKSLRDLSSEQMAIVADELNKRYFCPEVYEIKSVKDKMGYVYMEMNVGTETGKFDKNCAIKDVSRNIRMLDDDRLLIFDVDGNRYIISSLAALDKKSVKRLEPYLF